jgi:hypothetical protein
MSLPQFILSRPLSHNCNHSTGHRCDRAMDRSLATLLRSLQTSEIPGEAFRYDIYTNEESVVC